MQAKTIVWAKAISRKPLLTVKHANSPATYQFEVIEVLKGSNLGHVVTLDGDADLSGLWDTTFTNHTDREFLNDHHGRLGNVGDCITTPAPEFKLGSKYVLILGGVDDSKNYERVDNQQDSWYQLIKAVIENGK